MILVERHNIKGTPEIIALCRLAKELYNRANFLMRQAWFTPTNQKYKNLPDISRLRNEMKNLDCFKNLHNTKTPMQTIRQVLTDWSNYKKALTSYKKCPEKFLGLPKPPGYKKELAQVIFFSETIRKKPLLQGIITPTNDIFKIKSDKKFKQVVITPKKFGFIIDVSYDVKEQTLTEEQKQTQEINKQLEKKLDKNKLCTIDIGLNNLCAITLDQQNPILINGQIIKSINQWFNKRPTSKKRLAKRYFRIENYFHHVSKIIVSLCLKAGTGTIVIGKNDLWKQEMNLGKKTNQNFQYIPYLNLFQKIMYKASLSGIDVVFTEESYTSQASFFDNDPLPVYGDKDIPKFSGVRKHRGLYVTKDRFAVNADINGSLNIGRKINVIPESLRVIRDKSLVARPVRINPLKFLSVKDGTVNSSNSIV